MIYNADFLNPGYPKSKLRPHTFPLLKNNGITLERNSALGSTSSVGLFGEYWS